jgi:transposase
MRRCTRRNEDILHGVHPRRRTLDDLVPADHVCRVVDAFVGRLVMSELGFERAQAAETGRPGYNPRDLVEAVSVRLSEPDPLVAAPGS